MSGKKLLTLTVIEHSLDFYHLGRRDVNYYGCTRRSNKFIPPQRSNVFPTPRKTQSNEAKLSSLPQFDCLIVGGFNRLKPTAVVDATDPYFQNRKAKVLFTELFQIISCAEFA